MATGNASVPASLEDRPPRQAWIVVALLSVFMMINFADKAIIGLAAVPIIKELNLTHEEFGRVGSSFFLLFSVSAILGGFIANRVSSKVVIASMALLWAIVQLPMIGAVTLPMLIANRVILGAGEGPAYPVALHAVYKWFSDKQRTFPSALVGIGSVLGTGISAPLLTWIIVSYDWHVAFGFLGVVGLVWLTFWLAFGKEGAGCSTRTGGVGCNELPRIPYRKLLTCRTAIGSMLGSFSAYWALTLAVIWLPVFLIKGVGYTPTQAGWIVALPSVAQIFLAPSIGFVSQRLLARGWSSRAARGLLGGSCVMVSGLSMIGLSRVDGGLLQILLIVGSFATGSVMINLGAALIAEISPSKQRGAMLGINNAVYTLAGIGAPWVMGHAVDLGVDTYAGFRSGFAFAGILILLGGFTAVLLIRPKQDIDRFQQGAQRSDVVDQGQRSAVRMG